MKIKTDIHGKIPQMLIGDLVSLSQIINNLLSNAIKSTDKEQIKTILQVINADSETGEIRFSIVDTGTGIPDEKLKNNF